ncbi:unnamed protein product [Lathyrus sativus]|nr:unnamed protein product [Lathyrus sativus]
MEVTENRKWMNNRVDYHKNITAEFNIEVHEFIMFALAQDKNNIGGGNIRCPCKNCKCLKFGNLEEVKEHLCRRGFMSHYYHWTNHGEAIPPIPLVVASHSYYGSRCQREMFDNYEQLVMDAAGPEIGNYVEQEGQEDEDVMEEYPNEEAQKLFEMLKASRSPLWDGCDRYPVLLASLTTLSLKADYGLSEGYFNGWMQFMGNALPENNCMPKVFYQARKSIAELGLASLNIECCVKGCMLYYKEDDTLQKCKICGEERYKHIRRRGHDKLVPRKHMWYFPLVP